MNSIVVRRLGSSSPEAVERLCALLPQLSKSAPKLDMQMLNEILVQPSVDLFVALVEGEDKVVGMLTLIRTAIPTGKKAVVEDVVVDTAARGQNIGAKLLLAAFDAAYSYGARYVDLTSRPDLEAANQLYVRAGFVRRETNVYRYSLESHERSASQQSHAPIHDVS